MIQLDIAEQFVNCLPGSEEERKQFASLQATLAPMFKHIFPDRQAPRTIVVVPSLSLDPEELSKIDGIHHYEERLLCLLMLLQLPRTNIVFVTSQPIHASIIDYYLHLLPGIPNNHAQKRLMLLSCHDSSPVPLTEKILERPRLLQRIRNAIPDVGSAHLTCFNASHLERTLAVKLNIPLYACDPALCYLGSKSDGRGLFEEAGVDMPPGFEHLRDETDIVKGLVELKKQNSALKRAVVKLNEGFSGEGNAVFSYKGAPENGQLTDWVKKQLATNLKFEAKDLQWEQFYNKFQEMGGIVESWIDGTIKRSPSVQCRITPLGEVVVVSTHDQVLGGPSGQVFLGCSFPADEEYRLEIQEAGVKIANVLNSYDVLGRFAVDFISLKEGDKWKHYAIEINLRKGGTTLPFLMLQFLTNGVYNPENGLFYTRTGRECYYYASDNLHNMAYKGLTPDDLIDIMVYNQLHFHSSTQQGVVFHLMGALSEFGKFGVVCIGDSYERAKELYRETEATLNEAVNNN